MQISEISFKKLLEYTAYNALASFTSRLTRLSVNPSELADLATEALTRTQIPLNPARQEAMQVYLKQPERIQELHNVLIQKQTAFAQAKELWTFFLKKCPLEDLIGIESKFITDPKHVILLENILSKHRSPLLFNTPAIQLLIIELKDILSTSALAEITKEIEERTSYIYDLEDIENSISRITRKLLQATVRLQQAPESTKQDTHELCDIAEEFLSVAEKYCPPKLAPFPSTHAKNWAIAQRMWEEKAATTKTPSSLSR